jgi:CubicO group peptidase (beta-lactamase class C family)
MKQVKKLLVATLALAVGCAGAGAAVEKPLPPMKTSGAEARPIVTAETKELVRKMAPQVERFLRDKQSEAGFPALAVGLVAGDELIWSAGFGGRSDAVMRFGSVTKVVTSLAILQLRDEGKLELDDPAVKYLPELGGVIYPSSDCAPITIRQLLNHTSGLPRMGGLVEGASEKELLAGLNGLKLDLAPGSGFVYSNLAFALVGVIVARASGEPYRDHVTRKILGPLGMKSTVWDAPASVKADAVLGAAEPAGGLWTTVDDAARLAAFELDAWPPRDETDDGPLRRATVRESQQGGTWVNLHNTGMGPAVFHNGATKGYSSSVWLLPGRGLGLVMFANAPASQALDTLAQEALRIVSDAVPAPEPVMTEPVADAMARFVALMAMPDEKGIEELFAPSFLKMITVERALKTLQTANAGVCGAVRVLQVQTPLDARVRIDCPGGVFEVYLHLEESPPHKVDMAQIQPAR